MGVYRCLCCMEEFEDNSSICPHCGHSIDEQQSRISDLPMGTILDNKYIIGRAMGSGSFGVTYLAWDFENSQKIVIKEYFPTSFASRAAGTTEITTFDGEKSKQFEAGLISFINEANQLVDISANLGGIVEYRRVFIENSTAYIVIEYLDGLSFDKVISMGAIPVNDVIQLMTPVLESLSIVHKSGLINYNISPDNIIMTRDKRVMLLSFGSAKLDTAGFNKDIDIVTKKGFSAEELYSSNAKAISGPSSDVYSIAAVMYYAITGVVPVSPVERNEKNDIVPPSELGISIPKNIENALLNALNLNPQYRTPTCDAFIQELTAPDTRRVIEPKKKVDTGKWSKKMKAIVATSVFVVVAIIAALVTLIVVNKADTGKISTNNDTRVVDVGGKTLGEANDLVADKDVVFVIEGEEDTFNIEDNGRIIPGTQHDTPYDLYSEVEKNHPDFNKNKDGKIEIPVKIYVLKIKVPDIEGKTADQAKETLKEMGHEGNIKTTEDYSSRVAKGRIISCDQGGETIKYNDTVKIKVSKGPRPTTAAPKKSSNRTGSKKSSSKKGGSSGSSSGGGGLGNPN